MGSITFMELSKKAFGGGRETVDGTPWCKVILFILGLGAVACGVWFISSVEDAMDAKYKKEYAAYQASAYSAWVKLTGRTDITLEEWKALKNAGAINNK